MESLRSMINLLPQRTPSDAKFMADDKNDEGGFSPAFYEFIKNKELYLSLRFLATFAVNVKKTPFE